MENFEENINNISLCFRNRLNILINHILERKNLDVILLIFSYDSLYNSNILKLTNWLLFGYSGPLDLEEKSLPFNFNETFLMIKKDSIFIYSSLETKSFFKSLVSKINDIKVDFFFPTKKEQENSEILQILKISKFYENIKNFKNVGIPLKPKEKMNIVELEKWPLINAYGLDLIGAGFFTMKHEIIDISLDLENLYHTYDVYSCVSLVSERTGKMETVLADFFNSIDKEPVNKRLEKSELALNENQELDFLVINYFNLQKTKFNYLQNLPPPRVLYGTNTNKTFSDLHSTEAVCKNYFDYKTPSFHLTYENFDALTGIRIGRTFITSSLQRKYQEKNEDELFSYFESSIYNEAFFLFNIYYLFIDEFKFYQYDLITNKFPIQKFTNKLAQRLNDYIKATYLKTEKNFNYFIEPEKIIVNMEEYQILGDFISNKNPLNSNKIKILRVEIKDLISPISNKLFGGLLYCDSFIFCHEEIHNLTHDILPIKFFYTSHMHMRAKENYSYEPIKIIKQKTSSVKFNDIQYKGISFFREEYNIPYLFPSSKDIGFDSDQIFVAYEGKMAVFNDCFVFYENSLGIMLIEEENLLEIEHKEESHYSLLLIKLKDSDKFPLSGIIKNEILFYFYAANSSLKSYKFEMIDFLKKRYKSIFKSLSARKHEEYDIAIKTLDENKYFNLNYISNTFSYANILDSFYELLEFENFKCKQYQFETKNENLSFNAFKKNLSLGSIDLVTSINNTKKDKVIFIYSDILTNNSIYNFNLNNNNNNVLELIKQLGLGEGVNPNIICPNLDVIGDEQKLFEFYLESFKKYKSSKNKNTIIACVFNNFKIRDFMILLNKKYYKNFFIDFEIVNFAYCLNLEFTKINKNKTPIANLYTLNDELFSYLITEDDLVLPEKIQQRIKLLTTINNKLTSFNIRSFTRNAKEAKKIFECSNKNFEFILNNYLADEKQAEKSREKSSSGIESSYDAIFIPLEYKLDEEIFKKNIKYIINHPLLYTQEKNYFLKDKSNTDTKDKNINSKININTESIEYSNINAMMSDKEYQEELAEEIKKIKKRESEGEINSVVGKVCFFNDENKYIVKVNYSDVIVSKIENEKKNNTDSNEKFGLLFIGKNLNSNKENLRNFVYTLSGKLPQIKKYKTKSDMTEQEIMNLNLLYFEKELPEGWYLDGPVFVDPNDNRHSFHPHIDQFIDEFLKMTNLAVDKFNENVLNELDSLKIKNLK